MPVLAPPRASAAARPAGGHVLHGLSAPLRPASAAPAAANKIVRFLRTSGLPAPAASQLAPLAAGLAEVGRRLVGSVPVAGAIGALLSLGGDSAQHPRPATDLLPRLTRSRATLDQTFEALNDLVTATTGWPDLSGRRAALQSLLARSRSQIRGLAVGQPQQAARQLAALFALFELRAGDAGGADQGRLAAARAILARSRPAQAAATATQSAPPPASGPRPARALKGATPKGAAPKGTVPAVAPARVPALGSPPAPAIRPRGLVPPRADVTHTGRVGTAEEIATRQRQATARALREAAAIYYDRRKTLLAGDSEAALAERVYKDTPLQALGVSLAQFHAHLQAGQEPAEAAGARIRASASRPGSTGGSPAPRLPQLQQGRQGGASLGGDPYAWKVNSLSRYVVEYLTRPWEGSRLYLAAALSRRNGTVEFELPLPDSTNQPAAANVVLRRSPDSPGTVVVEAVLGELRVRHRFEIKDGGLVVDPKSASELRVGVDGWQPGGFLNDSGTFALPASFWLENATVTDVMQAINADARTMAPSWHWSTNQKTLLRNLFQHRDQIRRLIDFDFKSLDQARSTLIQAINAMERATPNLFPAETGWHLYPRENEKGTWGIAPPLVGRRLDVTPFVIDGDIPLRRPKVNAEKWNPGEFLHTHPSRPGGWANNLIHALRSAAVFPALRAGFSLKDVQAALVFGMPLSVYQHGTAFRLSVKPEWFFLRDDVRMDLMRELVQWNDAKADRSPKSIARLRAALDKLPLVFERASPLPRNNGLDPRPIASGGVDAIGPAADKIAQTKWVRPAPGVLEPE